jgi:hypothetical protein
MLKVGVFILSLLGFISTLNAQEKEPFTAQLGFSLLSHFSTLKVNGVTPAIGVKFKRNTLFMGYRLPYASLHDSDIQYKGADLYYHLSDNASNKRLNSFVGVHLEFVSIISAEEWFYEPFLDTFEQSSPIGAIDQGFLGLDSFQVREENIEYGTALNFIGGLKYELLNGLFASAELGVGIQSNFSNTDYYDASTGVLNMSSTRANLLSGINVKGSLGITYFIGG